MQVLQEKDLCHCSRASGGQKEPRVDNELLPRPCYSMTHTKKKPTRMNLLERSHLTKLSALGGKFQKFIFKNNFNKFWITYIQCLFPLFFVWKKTVCTLLSTMPCFCLPISIKHTFIILLCLIWHLNTKIKSS